MASLDLPSWPVTEAYGVPLLACEGIAAVVALGTDFLVVRVDSLPPEVDTKDPAPEWSFVHEGWHVISPWQSRLPGADAEHAVKGLVSAALTHAARLAQAQRQGRPPQPASHSPLTDW